MADLRITPKERASINRVNTIVTVATLIASTVIVKAVCLLVDPWMFINF